jgi:hypothetical protein
MQNDLTRASLSTLIPNRFQYMHTYNTRHINAFPLPQTQTSLYASYCLPYTLKLWNSLPPEIKDLVFSNVDLLLEFIMIVYLNIIITIQDWHKYFMLVFVWEVVLQTNICMQTLLLIILIVFMERLNLHIIAILLFLRQCINIFRKVNDFYKTQTHHVILYPECNLQFPFFSIPLVFSYLNNGNWVCFNDYFQFFMCFVRKQII